MLRGRRAGAALGIACLLVAVSARANEDVRVIAVRPGEVDVAPLPRPSMGRGIAFDGSRLLGRVVASHGDVATVKLPVDVHVRVGDRGEARDETGGGVDVIPPRVVGTSLEGELRLAAGLPWLDSSPAHGLQTIWSGEVVHRFSFPLTMRATLAHAALAFATVSNVAAVDFTVGASIDTDYFELGLGLGAISFNNSTKQGSDAGFVIEPLLRIGALDGIWLAATTQFAAVDGSFQWCGAFGSVTFPVANRYWWFFRGGLSFDGYTSLDFGIRTLVRGNGDRGSLFMRFSLGIHATFFSPLDELLIGPGAGVGVETRL